MTIDLKNVRIRGEINEQDKKRRVVYVNGELLDVEKSLEIKQFSKDVDWGFGGSPAFQLAFAICLQVYKDKGKAIGGYIKFKDRCVAVWRFGQPFEVTVDFTQFIHQIV